MACVATETSGTELSLEVSLYNHGRLVFDKGAKTVQRGKAVLGIRHAED